MHTPVTNINESVQKTQEWLTDLAEKAHYEEEGQAYTALRSVLHALRDRLTADEAAHLGAQLPMVIAGMYYDGFKPSSLPVDIETAQEFRDRVRRNMFNGLDPDHAIRSVFELLSEKVSAGEIEHVQEMLPEEIRALWPERVAAS